MKSNEIISDALGVEYTTESKLPAKMEPIVIENNGQDREEDYKLSRRTFRGIIKKGEEAIDELYELAKSSEHPRSYEVLATLMKTVSDTTKDLYDLQKKTKDLKGVKEELRNIAVDKAIFVGTTADLLKKVKENEDI